jgi:prepilin-type processing-associated H-X9-DG protein
VLRERKRWSFAPAELAAAVAIVGVLSALFLPTFARTRAQAGQAICLANVRSVTLAIRMYLADWDARFPPRETDPDVVAYFNHFPGRGDTLPWEKVPHDGSLYCHRSTQANPYLRWPVLLDQYVISRDVWRCPSARLEGGASFINGGGADWLSHLRAHEREWGKNTDFCPMVSWPAGWGGEVTDSLAQKRLAVPITAKGRAASKGMFLQSIGVNTSANDMLSASAVEQPEWYVICADGGATTDDFGTGTLAYPDLCALECAAPGVWMPDWENCPWSRDCGATPELRATTELRRPYARHFGGVNIGFLDGHANWFDSEALIALSPTTADSNRGRLRGYHSWGPTSDSPVAGISPLH